MEVQLVIFVFNSRVHPMIKSQRRSRQTEYTGVIQVAFTIERGERVAEEKKHSYIDQV
jgi:hypothetical protein